jgi:hypothetical protein
MALTGTVALNGAFNAQDTFGGKFYMTADYTGVNPYVPTVGEKLDPKAFGGSERILAAWGSGSEDGGFFVICYPSGPGYCDWYARWYISTTGAEATAVDLSAKTVKLTVISI